MEKLSIWTGLVLCALLAGPAHADPKIDEAKQHVQSGAQLYDENNFRGALVEFQRAYDLAPSYKILFNIAQVEMELQDYAGALKAYARYLREGGPDVPADRSAQVTTEIDRLKGRVGHVTVVTAAGAEVLIDDVSVGFAPLPEPVAVNAGPHKVTVHTTGHDPVNRMFDVAGRQDVTAALGDAVPVAPVVVPPPSPPTAAATPHPTGPKSKLPIYVAWSLAGGFAITAGVFALVTHSDESDLASLRNTYPVTANALESQRSKTARAAHLTDAFAAASLVTAGVALYLTLTRSHDPVSETSKAVLLQVGPGGVAVAGRF